MDIREILERASKLKIAIIGDLIIDTYIDGDVKRISPEAPVPVVRKTGVHTTLGGAGNVWMNLTNLGVETHLFCDGHPDEVQDTDRLHLNLGPMSKKTRVMSGGHHMLRIDEEIPENEITGHIFKDVGWAGTFLEMLREFNAIVISDYGKGAVSKSVAEMVVSHANDAGIPVIVDAKSRYERFGGADVLKMNQAEYRGLEDTYVVTGVRHVMEYFGVDKMVVTLGDKGMDYWERIAGEIETLKIPGINVPICDTCGAGDTVTAVLAMMYAMKLPFGYCCEIANEAAAEVCKHPGVYAITKEDLINVVR